MAPWDSKLSRLPEAPWRVSDSVGAGPGRSRGAGPAVTLPARGASEHIHRVREACQSDANVTVAPMTVASDVGGVKMYWVVDTEAMDEEVRSRARDALAFDGGSS